MMLEQVAGAIQAHTDLPMDKALVCARDAITAMREPTELMCAVGGVVIGMTPDKLVYDRAAAVFQKMIDVALEE